jgi:drug/metabolite transporter (DMT)-like permease
MARATLIGFGAVIMWSLLALLTDASGSVPPFLLMALTFAIAAAAGFLFRILQRPARPAVRVPPLAWLIGTAGLFGYHFFYFTALRNAPAAEASLIAYLWPILIVLGSALLPGERLAWRHVAGAGMGLAGTVLIVTGGDGPAFDPNHGFGYAMAAAGALLWASYSLLSRRFAEVPTSTVAWYCLFTAVLALICHLLLERSVWPEGVGQWLAVAALGLMPVGAAFYAWDHGVKRGSIQLLAVASYSAPLLSTFLLIAAGRAEATPGIAVSCLLISGGGLLAAGPKGFGRRPGKPA